MVEEVALDTSAILGQESGAGSSNEPAAAPDSGPQPTEGVPAAETTEGTLKAEIARLQADQTRKAQEASYMRQKFVELEKPIELGMAVMNNPDLLAQVEKKPGQPAQPAQQPQQPKELVNAIRQVVREEVGQTWDSKQMAQREYEKLQTRARKELGEDYDIVSQHPKYIDWVNVMLMMQERGTEEVKEGENPHFAAMEKAYKHILMSNSGYVDALKKTAKKEALDKAEKKAKGAAAGGEGTRPVDVGGERKLSDVEEERVGILKTFVGGRRLPSAR